MSEQLFVEAYDQMDDAILEMVLTDTVEKMCIESEENMEAIGNYVELLETGKSTSKYDDAFTAMIAETFTNEMVNCVSLFEAFDPSYGGDDDEYRKKYPEAFKKPLWARTKEAAKSKFADLRDTLRTYKKISLEPRMKAWGEKLKTLQARLSPTRFKEAIKRGYNKAKEFVGTKYKNLSGAVTSGLAAAKFKAADKMDQFGKKISKVGGGISRKANAMA